jgi:hypothetical protein
VKVKTPYWLRFNRRKIETAIAFVIIGVALRLALRSSHYANIEPVMALTIIASMVMPLVLAALIPIVIMAISDVLIYTFDIGGLYGLTAIIGITFFVWTGFLIASLVGWRLKKRITFRFKTLGVVTLVGVITTLVWDLWTDVEWWYFMNRNLVDVLSQQAIMTVIHVMSTIVFIPLFGSGYLLLTEHKTEFSAQAPRDSPEGEARPGV